MTVIDPLGKEPNEVIDVIPDMSLNLKLGVLSGRDRGEFGGELTYRKFEDRSSLVLMERNIKAIYGSDNSAIVIYRYSHMFKSEGKIFLFLDNGKAMVVCEIASYNDDIKDIHAVDAKTIHYTVSDSNYVLDSKLKIDNNSLHSAH